MNKELIKIENRMLRAYVDYFIEQYSRYMDEDDINEIVYFFSMRIFRYTEEDRDRREKVLRDYTEKRKKKDGFSI